MDRAFYILAIATAIGVGYGLLRGRRSSQKSRSGWIGLGILAILFLGLAIAGEMGHQSLAWFFGLALMAILAIMFFLAIGSAVAKALDKDKERAP